MSSLSVVAPQRPPTDIVVFGGNGDLARKKLIPSLYHLSRSDQLPQGGRVLGASRAKLSRERYLQELEQELRENLPPGDYDEGDWLRFAERVDYTALDATEPAAYAALSRALQNGSGSRHDAIYYMATAPSLFGVVSEHLGAAELITERSRVVLEKPLGHDLRSSRAINDAVGAVFAEDRIFRIDHYLGKAAVQNLIALRFANSIFEGQWNARYIDHVQITLGETLGVGRRWGYYDGAGALRDMVQNHLLQVLCLVAMEPPTALDQDAVRDEKLKILRSLRPITAADASKRTVRGQYTKGAIDGAPVPGYLEEEGARATSTTETFVALRAEIDNWRWRGVPFYLRTGKRMHARAGEVCIQFKPVPHSIFPASAGEVHANRLVIRLQPDDAITLLAMCRVPGKQRLHLQPAPLKLNFAETFADRTPDAYERLLMDVIRGVPTLFMRRDEVDAAWGYCEPILEAWDESDQRPHGYAAGTWGPTRAIALIERDGRSWHEPTA